MTVLEMPKLSDTMKEGTIARWLKKEGDKVTSGMPLLEIETDKATMEFEAPANGVLLKILIKEREPCALQTPIAVIGKAGENWETLFEQFKNKKSGNANKSDVSSKPAAPAAVTTSLKTAPKDATVLEMPKLSDTMKEGAISRWLKKEGDKVTSGMPLLEIETDKATMEFEAPANGVLLKILVKDGEKCALKAPIAVIGKEGADWQAALDAKAAKQSESSHSTPSSKPSPSAPKNTISSSTHLTHGSQTRLKISPLARKMARDLGIDVQALQGTGPFGRIIAKDLQTAKNSSSISSVSTQRLEDVTIVPLTSMRKTIAARLTESVTTAPHFFLTLSLNVGPLVQWRKDAIAKLPEEKKFSINDLIVFLVSRALAKHPEINASWSLEGIKQFHYVNMCIAVALPTGLVTPVIRHSDKMSLLDIALESKRLIALAKNGKLQSADLMGGTFTISNLGMTGVEEFTAIINPPQAAILAVGSPQLTPVFDAQGNVIAENRMKITLSCDHRVIDGAVGSAFLKTLKEGFEDPLKLFFFS